MIVSSWRGIRVTQGVTWDSGRVASLESGHVARLTKTSLELRIEDILYQYINSLVISTRTRTGHMSDRVSAVTANFVDTRLKTK